MANSGHLAGLSIVNTRANHQAQPLTGALAAHGAKVLHYPAIRILPLVDTTLLDNAITETLEGRYDWLVLTSANTVQSLAQRLAQMKTTRTLTDCNVRFAAVGSATAEAAARLLGTHPALIPEKFLAESLATSLALRPGERIFLPQSEIARPFLAEALQVAGGDVTQVVAYGTAMGQGGDPIPQLFWEGRIDAVTFTSPSTVHNFLKRLKAEGGNAGMLVDVVVACIGPQTADAAHSHDLPAPVQALCDHFETAHQLR
jgi:uroporphyrinogen-III synthase